MSSVRSFSVMKTRVCTVVQFVYKADWVQDIYDVTSLIVDGEQVLHPSKVDESHLVVL